MAASYIYLHIYVIKKLNSRKKIITAIIIILSFNYSTHLRNFAEPDRSLRGFIAFRDRHFAGCRLPLWSSNGHKCRITLQNIEGVTSVSI